MRITIEMPEEVIHFELPRAVQSRLQFLLDKQDSGEELTPTEKEEAEGLINLAEFLSYLRLNVGRTQHNPDGS